ncbi:MAG: phospholipase D-like domain-containing protein, partial [Bacteroidota bacterium]
MTKPELRTDRLLYRLIRSTILLLLALPFTAFSQGIIINEVYNSGGSDEWLELLVVEDSLNLSGWTVRDFSSDGTPQLPLVFANSSLWSSLRKGTIIVVARPEMGIQEDLDPSDFILQVSAGNTGYFSGNPFLIAGSSDALQIRTPPALHVSGLSWGANNAGSLPDPKIHFSGSLDGGRTVYFDGGSVGETTSPSAWAFNSASSSMGSGNSSVNSSWINALRLTADGSGSAFVQPDTLSAGDQTPLTVLFRRDTAFTLLDLRIILPATFAWSRSLPDVEYTNMAATASVSGDTILFTSVAMSADSTLITINGVTAPDSTAVYPVEVQTRASQEFRNVSPLPSIVVFGLPEPIGDVKLNDVNGIPLRVNTLVTIRGVITAANEFGSPSYLQDNSAGMAIYGPSFSAAVQRGDEVIVTGLLQPFAGLTEIVNPILHWVVDSGNVTEPLLLTLGEIAGDGAGGVELYEGLLVRLNGVRVLGSGVWAGGTNYQLTDGIEATEIRIDNSTDLVGAPIPAGSFDLVGVVGQYVTSSPYIGGYQVMPRTTEDILTSGPVFLTFPVESEILPTRLTVAWLTLHPGTSMARLGRTPSFEMGLFGSEDLVTDHAVSFDGLDPATTYYIQAFSAAGSDTSVASALLASTASPLQSPGEVIVYFNKSVDPSVAWSDTALGNQNLVSRLSGRIGGAHRSIDASLYNLSGAAGTGVANALVNAKSRGVKVRVVCEEDNRDHSPFNLLANNGIPVITDASDPVLKGAGLMHNKFFVFDARGGAPESTWVWTGSWNPSQSGTFDDEQNSIELQDVSLALTYTREFEEMWGGSADLPNPAGSRFGARKTDNTAHRFIIGGSRVECYFSPSDGTTSRIIARIDSARHSVAFALLTFTRSDIRTVLVAQKVLGRAVRGVMDNNTDTGTQYYNLIAGGVDVQLKSGSYLHHHKYGIIDGEDPTWDPVVIT